MDVILFGPPGAGKGTQATAVCQALDIPHVSTGDIFRAHLKSGSKLGMTARSYMDRGALVPDVVVCDIVVSRLVESDATGGALLDGFPRTVPQAELLYDWLDANGREIGLVISLEVRPEVLVRRLSGRRTCTGCGATYHVDHNPPSKHGVCDRCGGEVVQRKDDSESTVKARLETYLQETAPVLEWLDQRSTVLHVDGELPIDEVRRTILAALKR